MTIPEGVMVQMVAEIRSHADQVRQLHARAIQLRNKWNSNNLGSENMPAGETSTAVEVRGAFYHLVTDLIAYMESGSVGTADRVTTLNILNRASGV